MLTATTRTISPRRLVAVVCAAQILAQIGAYAWPALIPGRMAAWGIDNTDAGWITGLFYLAYTVSVPVLVTLTDRVDPKRVYLFGVAVTVLGHVCFATLADGFWTAAFARVLAGVGWAGTYMTGLKLLADRVDGKLMSRAVAGHALSIGVAGAASFAFTGIVEDLLGWQAVFWASAGCAAIAWLIVGLAAPAQEPKTEVPTGRLFDFAPVLRNRSAMAYALAYCVHTWEMNTLRGWGVAFLAWVALTTGSGDPWLPATAAITLVGLVGTWASVAGNEVSIRLGRQRLVRVAMVASAVCAALIGFLGPFSYELAVVLILIYGVVIWLDSSSLTAGAAGSADPGRRGATLAVHSMLGYAGGFVGPLAMGVILDLAGGMSTAGWGLGFLHVAAAMLLGRVAFAVLRPKTLAGDRAET
ncbi:Permease of the major facilitator superfamily protein [alpha proteobacterium BAL199]|jgi:predicted MFS family arabinose efflux permease|nr:Permease of the major facilitator superfamily protein [alpha proteobacterium BAL199]